MKTAFQFVTSCLIALSLLGCATSAGKKIEEPKTQLQMREYQTRSFETSEFAMVMKAMLNVLQDEGYIIKNADSELGFVTATREVDVENKANAFLATLWAGRDARWKKNTVEECSANVTQLGKQCKVRANFQVKLLDNVGNVVNIQQVDDEQRYIDFFAKVDKGIFLQKEGI